MDVWLEVWVLGEEWVDEWDNGLARVVMGWERRGMAR
jgi:hypothetical protein